VAPGHKVACHFPVATVPDGVIKQQHDQLLATILGAPTPPVGPESGAVGASPRP